MALIQPLNKTIEVINAINSGNDTEATGKHLLQVLSWKEFAKWQLMVQTAIMVEY